MKHMMAMALMAATIGLVSCTEKEPAPQEPAEQGGDPCYVFHSQGETLEPGQTIEFYPKADEADDLYYAIAGAARALGYVCAPSLMLKTIAECPDEVCDLSLYRGNRATLYAALTALGFECVRPEGAFYLMVKAPDGSSAEMSRKAMELGLLLVPGDSFGCPDYVRIAYCVPRQTVRDSIPAFARLKALYE